ncbi:MAG: ABC transporter permease [Ekhidna sp.]|nr:ABC transporter permease [Ekhidna sp.]
METTMFRNYLKVGIRNLWKYKSGTVINVIGLSTGIAAFLLITLTIRYELNFDKHFEDVDQLYRVTVKNYSANGELSRHWALASAGHADRLKQDYGNIEKSARIYMASTPDLTYEEKTFPQEQVVFTNEDFFSIFSFNFIAGNKENVFPDLYSIVLTESTAIKIFGNDWEDKNILGSSIELARQRSKAPFKVTAVIEDMPDQQHFHFDYLAPIRFLELVFDENVMNRIGGNYNWLTYIKVSENTNIHDLENQINDQFWDKYIGTFDDGTPARDYYDFYLQPVSDIHTKSHLNGEVERNTPLRLLQIFGVIGVLLLLIACINYMNIATSHYSRRMKEVGVRKVVGAHKTALVRQFLIESMLLTLISIPFCLSLVNFAIQQMNRYLEINLVFNLFNEPRLLLLLLFILIVVSIIAGFYPALFLSKIRLTSALKGEQKFSDKWNLRSILVTFQYCVTIGLIFAIVIIENQLQYIRKSDPGYNRNNVVRMNLPRDFNKEMFKNDLLSNPNILNASYSSRIPTGKLDDYWGTRHFIGDSLVNADFRLSVISVDPDFMDTYEIELVAGESFRDNMLTVLDWDTIVSSYYIVNEAASKALGYQNANDVLNEKIEYGITEGRIIGVVEDFHFESLHNEIEPMLFIYQENFRGLSVKIASTNIQESLYHMEETFAQYESVTSVHYNFVDELFERQYIKEKISANLVKVFALIAILISCLGLIGLVGFTVETKLKEIGVRKILGASPADIWHMISYDFLTLVIIASIVSLPVMFYLMNEWLNAFQYRVDISMLNIVSPILAVLLITLATISYQVIKATRVNPVECLKDE